MMRRQDTSVVMNIPMAGTGLDRRSACAMGAKLFALLASSQAMSMLPGCAFEAASKGDNLFVLNLLGLVIPDGDLPGAGNQANSEFVVRAVGAGLFGIPTDTLDRLATDLRTLGGAELYNLPRAAQEKLVATLDARTFADGAPRPAPWISAKALILIAYFTSQAGAERALRYEFVPGRYDPDILIDRDWRPLSNDWTANAVRKAIDGQ